MKQFFVKEKRAMANIKQAKEQLAGIRSEIEQIKKDSDVTQRIKLGRLIIKLDRVIGFTLSE